MKPGPQQVLLSLLFMVMTAPAVARLARRSMDKEDPAAALEDQLLACKNYDTKDTCEAGERSARCEWLDVYDCQERETQAVKTLSDAECNYFAGNMDKCMAGVGCVFDSISGSCVATPSICSQITCGEERQPPQPLVCLPPLKK